MKGLMIRPLEPLKLSPTPTLPSSHISMKIDHGVGIPLPSTVIGALGALLDITLDATRVQKDPLLGLGTILDELKRRYKTTGGNEIIQGPLVRVGDKITIPLYHKKYGALYADIKAIINMDVNEPRINPCNIVGKLEKSIQEKITLNDRQVGGVRVVQPGGYYRTSFSWIAGMKCIMRGEQPVLEKVNYHIDYSFIYKLNLEDLVIDKIVIFGGESRLAHAKTIEFSDELNGLMERLRSICTAKAGYYITLSPTILLPKNVTNYYIPKNFEGPELEVIGIPPITVNPFAKPKPRVAKIGLGYSVVARIRRPLLPALPPGTLVKLGRDGECIPESLQSILSGVGYNTLLKI